MKKPEGKDEDGRRGGVDGARPKRPGSPPERKPKKRRLRRLSEIEKKVEPPLATLESTLPESADLDVSPEVPICSIEEDLCGGTPECAKEPPACTDGRDEDGKRPADEWKQDEARGGDESNRIADMGAGGWRRTRCPCRNDRRPESFELEVRYLPIFSAVRVLRTILGTTEQKSETEPQPKEANCDGGHSQNQKARAGSEDEDREIRNQSDLDLSLSPSSNSGPENENISKSKDVDSQITPVSYLERENQKSINSLISDREEEKQGKDESRKSGNEENTQEIQTPSKVESEVERCMVCQKEIPREELENHVNECLNRQEEEDSKNLAERLQAEEEQQGKRGSQGSKPRDPWSKSRGKKRGSERKRKTDSTPKRLKKCSDEIIDVDLDDENAEGNGQGDANDELKDPSYVPSDEELNEDPYAYNKPYKQSQEF